MKRLRLNRCCGPRRQQGRQNYAELFGMVALMGILAALAIPAYLDYATRSRVGTGISLAVPARLAIAESFDKNGPADMSQRANTGWSPPAATKEVESLAVARNGAITIVYTSAVAEPGANQLHIVPVAGGELFDLSDTANRGKPYEWQCGGPAGRSTLAERYRPSKCRPEASGESRWWIAAVVLIAVFGVLAFLWAPLRVSLSRLWDEILATLTNPGALGLGITLLVPIGLVFHAAFDDPRTYHRFHDAERARAIVTELHKVREFPALWQATVAWTDASRTQRSAQIEVGPTDWWKTDSPEISVGMSTDMLLSRSQPGATAWRKDPPTVVPWELLGVEFNPEALALALLFSFAGLTAMMVVRAQSEGALKKRNVAPTAPGGGIKKLGKLLDRIVTGFFVVLFLLIIIGSFAYASGFNIFTWLGLVPE